MRQLPFMNGIKAFEAAARSGSFAKAADELHVTPAAVSRMVHLLEARLGVTLFERKANRLLATPAGHAYQGGLTQLFDQLAALTQQVTAIVHLDDELVHTALIPLRAACRPAPCGPS